MFFDRIIRNLKENNWGGLIFDFALIVVGVFVGIQIDGWNEDRKDRGEEQVYLSRLHDDITESITRNQDQLDFMKKQGSDASLILRTLSACELSPADQDTFATGLFQSGKLFPGFLRQGTINELFSTGKLAVIQNLEVRQKLNKTIEVYESNHSLFSQVIGRINPHINYIDSVVAYRIEGPLRGNMEITWSQLEVDFDALCKDRRFYTAVASLRNYAFDVATWSQENIGQFKSLKETLEHTK